MQSDARHETRCAPAASAASAVVATAAMSEPMQQQQHSRGAGLLLLGGGSAVAAAAAANKAGASAALQQQIYRKAREPSTQSLSPSQSPSQSPSPSLGHSAQSSRPPSRGIGLNQNEPPFRTPPQLQRGSDTTGRFVARRAVFAKHGRQVSADASASCASSYAMSLSPRLPRDPQSQERSRAENNGASAAPRPSRLAASRADALRLRQKSFNEEQLHEAHTQKLVARNAPPAPSAMADEFELYRRQANQLCGASQTTQPFTATAAADAQFLWPPIRAHLLYMIVIRGI